jgi:hypothetical protein
VRIAVALGVALCAFGCGGGGKGGDAAQAFLGSWKGTFLGEATKCSDGSTAPDQSTPNIIVTLTEVNTSTTGHPQIDWHPKCGVIRLCVYGTTAYQDADVDCPPTTNMDGSVTHIAFSGTALMLTGQTLELAYTAKINITQTMSPTITCDVPGSASLTKSTAN